LFLVKGTAMRGGEGVSLARPPGRTHWAQCDPFMFFIPLCYL
jgi:hypothetical protein